MDNADAFVHAYSCALAAKNGDPVATKLFTDAHEEKWAGYPNLQLEIQMDLHNNAVGIAIGEANSGATDEYIAIQVINAIQAGQMWRISNINYSATNFESTGGIQPNSLIVNSGSGLCN